MMDLASLEALIDLLRRKGVISYQGVDCQLVLGPEPIVPPYSGKQDADAIEAELKGSWRGFDPEDLSLLGVTEG